jgi:metallo-beta-lactamase class B
MLKSKDMKQLLTLAFLLAGPVTVAQQAFRPDPPIVCTSCDEWNAPQVPLRVFGNTYYVGTAGLSSVLVTSDAGHILIDGALPQSAPLIEANIRALGFQLRDVRLILNSHEHYDHAGGIAALQRASGARVAASPSAARAFQLGHPTPEDPQYQSGRKLAYPPIAKVETIADGATLKVGSLSITAHFTPGHTPGATSWSWRSCEGSRCVNIVYSDSLNAVSDDGFKFTAHSPLFRRSINRVEQLPCDIVIPPHPGFINLSDKAARMKAKPQENPFVDSNACRSYAALARKRLEARVAEER